ncbi:MAG: hypothetical protein L6W00_08885 [Lentisphaeria bacterium]|nr:MAG: hypothetical protein L6W00_08885 [Lentisphaeria bacterium]
MDQIFAVRLDNGSSLDIKASSELGLQPHDLCVFRRDFYTDLGEIRREVPPPANPGDLPTALRKAETADLATANANDAKARSAMQTAHRFVNSLGLEMKLLNAHYSLDGKLVTIQFSADGRVDFRELVKELSRALCTRIELRQIGVRDETGIHGGIAVCGQQLCCSRFLKEFNSINVKMAKEQDLSLTPATISGVCGRLKCCLKYEHEGYQEFERGCRAAESGATRRRGAAGSATAICLPGGCRSRSKAAMLCSSPARRSPSSRRSAVPAGTATAATAAPGGTVTAAAGTARTRDRATESRRERRSRRKRVRNPVPERRNESGISRSRSVLRARRRRLSAGGGRGSGGISLPGGGDS